MNRKIAVEDTVPQESRSDASEIVRTRSGRVSRPPVRLGIDEVNEIVALMANEGADEEYLGNEVEEKMPLTYEEAMMRPDARKWKCSDLIDVASPLADRIGIHVNISVQRPYFISSSQLVKPAIAQVYIFDSPFTRTHNHYKVAIPPVLSGMRLSSKYPNGKSNSGNVPLRTSSEGNNASYIFPIVSNYR